jgi:hypothetical protein
MKFDFDITPILAPDEDPLSIGTWLRPTQGATNLNFPLSTSWQFSCPGAELKLSDGVSHSSPRTAILLLPHRPCHGTNWN